MSDTGLFGQPVQSPRKGCYADVPGTGPAGQTCGTCMYLHRRHSAGTYLKCWLMREYWTGGAGTDIKAGSPACRYWVEKRGMKP